MYSTQIFLHNSFKVFFPLLFFTTLCRKRGKHMKLLQMMGGLSTKKVVCLQTQLKVPSGYLFLAHPGHCMWGRWTSNSWFYVTIEFQLVCSAYFVALYANHIYFCYQSYVQKKKGKFQHSSFLAGGATTASGRLVTENGILKVCEFSYHIVQSFNLRACLFAL